MNTETLMVPNTSEARVQYLLQTFAAAARGVRVAVVFGRITGPSMTDMCEDDSALVVEIGAARCAITLKEAQGIVDAAQMLEILAPKKTTRYTQYLALAEMLALSIERFGGQIRGLGHGNHYLH